MHEQRLEAKHKKARHTPEKFNFKMITFTQKLPEID